MFKDCARLERDMFMTWKEDDVNEQDVDERKECWRRKRVLSHIWVKSESDLGQIATRLLTSFNHYAKYSLAWIANWLELQSYWSWYVCNRFSSMHMNKRRFYWQKQDSIQ